LNLGNRISAMLVPLPVGVDDPVVRLREVHRATSQRNQSHEAGKLGRMMRLADILPVPLQQLMLGHAPEQAVPLNTICTNVPGPPCRLYQQGVGLDGIVPFVPLAGEVGVAFAALSYADALTIGVTTDAGVVPHGNEVIRGLRASFDELRQVTAGREGR
jgi:diacylglycerol O-acyltransferase